MPHQRNISPKPKYITIYNDGNRSTIDIITPATPLDLYNKSAQSNLGRGSRRCESVPRGCLMTAKVVAGEFITPHQLLPTLWAKPAHIAKTKVRRSSVLKIDVAASVVA